VAYPDAAYISIVRDGRDVARSMVDVDLGTDDLARAARYWADSVRAARRDGAPLERFREVRYEQLVADPVGGVAELMAWVGMEVDDGVRAAIAERAGVRVSEHGSRGPVGPGKWRTMDSADVAVVEREAGDLLVELGYAEARPKRWRRR
jgi:hypothetical protein